MVARPVPAAGSGATGRLVATATAGRPAVLLRTGVSRRGSAVTDVRAVQVAGRAVGARRRLRAGQVPADPAGEAVDLAAATGAPRMSLGAVTAARTEATTGARLTGAIRPAAPARRSAGADTRRAPVTGEPARGARGLAAGPLGPVDATLRALAAPPAGTGVIGRPGQITGMPRTAVTGNAMTGSLASPGSAATTGSAAPGRALTGRALTGRAASPGSVGTTGSAAPGRALTGRAADLLVMTGRASPIGSGARTGRSTAALAAMTGNAATLDRAGPARLGRNALQASQARPVGRAAARPTGARRTGAVPPGAGPAQRVQEQRVQEQRDRPEPDRAGAVLSALDMSETADAQRVAADRAVAPTSVAEAASAAAARHEVEAGREVLAVPIRDRIGTVATARLHGRAASATVRVASCGFRTVLLLIS
jgi:hypothetical protein